MQHSKLFKLPLFLVPLALVAGPLACDSGNDEGKGSLVDQMKKADEEEEEKPADPNKKKDRDLPTADLPPPSDAEVKAWDRKDPEGEKHLYKWDKRNLPKMWNYYLELRCYKEKIKEEGQKAYGQEPGGPEQEQWYQFKRVFIPFLDRWQQRLFANEPRILEKSKFIGHFLEVHELIMRGYPGAYNESDELELKKQDAHWILVEDKIVKYVDRLGGASKYKLPDPESAKDMKKWEKFCGKAMLEKKDKGPKKVKEKTPI
jgi:hypothetical protein